MQFTEEQKKVIEEINGHILVVACPGSGKTTTMLARVQHMIDMGIEPSKILVVTFSKAAAVEMNERFLDHYGSYPVCFATIHSICFSILRQEKKLTKDDIIKEWEQIKHFKQKLKGGIDKAYIDDAARYIMSLISTARNAGMDPLAVYDTITFHGKEIVFAPLYISYQKLKRDNNKIDFDDMVILCKDLLKKSPLVLAKYQKLYDYIIIDEYQDTNKIQAQIFYMLSEVHGNLCVVGDDDQSIYGFRAADSKIMLGFKKKFPDAKRFSLSTNYRSGRKIVECAEKMISKNTVRYDKKFIAHTEEEGEIGVGCYVDELDENVALIQWIEDLKNSGEKYKNIAVLYRTNSDAVSLLPMLKKKDIPVNMREKPGDIHSHFVFEAIKAYYYLSDAVTKEGLPESAVEYLPKILNCPNRYLKVDIFGKCTLTNESVGKCIKAYIASGGNKNRRYKIEDDLEELKYLLMYLKGKKPSSFLNRVVNNAFRDWLKAACEYRDMSFEMATNILDDIVAEGNSFQTMADWMEYCEGYAEIMEEYASNPEGVVLSTFHGSKGLEWEHVWTKNVSEQHVPYFKSLEEDPQKGEEEERRMFYVAVTRAKKELQCSFIKKAGKFIPELIGEKTKIGTGVQKTI